jgi:hypothetical protein
MRSIPAFVYPGNTLISIRKTDIETRPAVKPLAVERTGSKSESFSCSVQFVQIAGRWCDRVAPRGIFVNIRNMLDMTETWLRVTEQTVMDA